MKIFKHRKLKGAISIFLIIITVPTMLFSAVLIDGSRMQSARAMTQEAADLAAASALAVYNEDLKDEFGLFAIDDNEKLEAIYKESLEATLLAYGMSGDAEYSERLWDIMKTTMTGQKSYMGESFLNLYDFSVDQCKVKSEFCLAEADVLENQMVEYAKFRGIYVMTDRMSIFSELGNMKEEAQKNEVTAEVMEDKMDVDQSNASADRELSNLREEINSLNALTQQVGTPNNGNLAAYLTSLRAKMEQIRIENIDTEDTLSNQESQDADAYERQQDALKQSAQAACKQADKVLRQAKKAEGEIEKAIQRLEHFQSDNQSKASGNEAVGELFKDADENIDMYKEDYLRHVKDILNDPVLNEMKADTNIASNLDNVMTRIHKAVTAYTETIKQMREQMEASGGEEDGEGDDDGEEDSEEDDEITEYYYYYLNSSESTLSANTAINGGSGSRYYQPAVTSLIKYFAGLRWDPDLVDPSKKYEGTSDGKISEDFAKGQSGKKGDTETNLEGEAPRGVIDEAVYKTRPSETYVSEEEKNINTSFYNKDSDLTASKNILNQGKHSMILDIGETVRDDVLCLTYMFGTFKTRLTGVKKFSAEGMSASDKDSFYMPEWRHTHPEGELDMRFSPKKDRETVLRSEIEYLVYGNSTDSKNEAAVYATIFAERLANNLIAMYMEKKVVNPSCHVAAGAASAATLGWVPEPVFFWIFLTAWATAETIIEMDYLISGGYRIPLFKTKDNILLNEIPNANGQGLMDHYGKKGLFVSYEDYLLILLLIKGRDKRIMRTADLVEMNMKKGGQPDFTMAEAYTYLCADTQLSIRYLFGSVMPFQAHYEKNGYKGRMHFTNKIYLGY